MELYGTPRFRSVAYAFDRAIVPFLEPDEPRFRQSRFIDRKAVVLGCDVASTARLDTWLILSAVTILELERRGASSEREELIAEADTEYRRPSLHYFADGMYSLGAHLRIPRTVGEHECIKIFGREVMVPRHANNGGLFSRKRSDNVFLGATIDKEDAQRSCSVLTPHPRAHACDEVFAVRVVEDTRHMPCRQ